MPNLEFQIQQLKQCQRSQTYAQVNPEVFILTDLFEPNGTDVIFKTEIKSADLTSHLSKPYTQNTCGSCYGFSSLVHFESLFWKDFLFYKQNSNYDYFTNGTSTQNLRFSIEYLMDNTVPTNKQCGGGTFVYTAQYYSLYWLPTVELEKTFPYDSMFSTSENHYIEENKRNTSLTPEQYLNLEHIFTLRNSVCPQTLFNLAFQNEFNPNGNPKTAAIVMSILTRGIAVVGQMQTDGASNDELNTLYNFYGGGILQGDCTTNGSNHQITFVGFGTFKGTNVWLIQNSYGRSWGENGYFYVERGKNSFCTENVVGFMLNRYYKYSEYSGNDTIQVGNDTISLENRDDSVWEQTQEFKYLRDNNILVNINEKIFKRGINGLDNDDGTFTDMKAGPFLITLIILLIIILLIILYFTGVWICCPPQMTIMPTMYIKFTSKQRQEFDWSNSLKFYVQSNSSHTYPLQ